MWGNKAKVKNNIPLGTDFLRTRIDQELNKDEADIDWEFIHDKMDTIMENENWDMSWAPDPDQAYAACMARAEGKSLELPEAKPQKSRRKKRIVPIVAAACIAVALAGSVYAGQIGHPRRLSNNLELSLTNADMTLNYTRTDFQTDSQLYRDMEANGTQEVLLPDPAFLEGYAITTQEMHPRGESELYSTAEVRWEKNNTYIQYKVRTFELSYSFSFVSTTDYAWYDEITRDGLTFQICRSPGSTTVVFRAYDDLYFVTTNLGSRDLLTFIESIH